MESYNAVVITPVKNALENTLETIRAIKKSTGDYLYFVYDDYSEPAISEELKAKSSELGYTYIHLSELTNTPSPNYFTVLKDAQKKSVAQSLPLIIVESDVVVEADTFAKMIDFTKTIEKVGMIGAVTVDYDQKVNFPYLKFVGKPKVPTYTERSLSFCCTLLHVDFLKKYSFDKLDQSKDWFDTTISYQSISEGFKNYILLDVPVLHKPHGSRPWKQLKYTNPLKYYWRKLTQKKDKI